MLLLNLSSFLSSLVFIYMFYAVSLVCVLLYLLPTLGENHFNASSSFYNKNNFFMIKGACISTIVIHLFILVFFSINYCLFFTNSIWMGHISMSAFAKKIFLLIFIISLLYFYSLLSYTNFSSRESYDFIIVNINMILWVYLLFLSNSIISSFFTNSI